MSQEIQSPTPHQILARCWTDAVFKALLLADPTAALNAEGLVVPAGVHVRVLENTAQLMYLVIPARPADLTDEMLDDVVGAAEGAAPGAPSPGRDFMRKNLAAMWMAKYFPLPKN
jgi:hypothetical protein